MSISAYQIVHAQDITGEDQDFAYAEAVAALVARGLQVASVATGQNDDLYRVINTFYGFGAGLWIDHPPSFTAWAPGYPAADHDAQPYLNNQERHRGWRDGVDQVSGLLVQLDVARFVSGPAIFNAVFSVRPGLVLEGRSGADVFVGTSGADTLIGGGGADALYGGPDVWTGGGGADIFSDGDGADLVIGSAQSTLKAAMDGDDDFYQVGKIDYSSAKEDIAIVIYRGSSEVYAYNEKSFQYGSEDPQVARNEIGRDNLTGTAMLDGAVYTGGGNDSVGWTGGLVNTGAGDDTIYGWSDFLIAEGGEGNDQIFLMGHGGRAIGGQGRDWIQAHSDGMGGPHEMTGGAGGDTFAFLGFDTTQARQIIWDMHVSGPEEDHIVFEDMFTGAAPNSVQDALDQGVLRIRYERGYTYLDIDGDGGGDQYDATFVLKGVFGADLYDNIVFN